MKILLCSRRSNTPDKKEIFFKREYGNRLIDRTFVNHWGWFWHKALEELGHKVIPFAFWKGFLFDRLMRKETLFLSRLESSFKRRIKVLRDIELLIINRAFLRSVERERPDLIFLDTAETILPETLRAVRLKFPGIIIVNWLLDDPFQQDSWRPVVEGFKFCDCVFIFDKFYMDQIRAKGAPKVVYMPGACDPDVHSDRFKDCIPDSEKTDVCFVGTVTPFRIDLLRDTAGYTMGLWTRTPQSVLRKNGLFSFYKGTAYGEKTSAIFSTSKISLNFHHPQSMYGANLRTFEIAGSRGFQLVDYKREVCNLFNEGTEIIVCRDASEFKKKIPYYLSHGDERVEIAANAQKKAYQEHTYKQRMEEILEIVKSI
jgi:spore maturation protein CgeB